MLFSFSIGVRPTGVRQTSLRILGSVILTAGAALAQNAQDIVQKSVERDWTDYSSRKDYTYQERLEIREYGSDGNLNKKRSETNEVLVLEGRPYDRLVARDGRPLNEKDARKEQEKLDRESEKRRSESPAERAKIEKDRAAQRKFIREVPQAFQFRLDGVDKISGQPVWVIDATPKPGFKPVESQAKLFAKVHAKVWIDQATYHWVKVDAQALDTLSFGLGLLRVAPGGTLHFEQTRVNDEIWLPSLTQVRADARLALLKKLRAEIDFTYHDYKKFQTDSRLIVNPAE